MWAWEIVFTNHNFFVVHTRKKKPDCGLNWPIRSCLLAFETDINETPRFWHLRPFGGLFVHVQEISFARFALIYSSEGFHPMFWQYFIYTFVNVIPLLCVSMFANIGVEYSSSQMHNRCRVSSLFHPGTSGGGGYFGVKRIGMTVGNPRKLP